jgi:hypothetical protein
MYIYLTQNNGREWNSVEARFESISAAKSAIEKLAGQASCADDAMLLDSLFVVSSDKKISVGKNINNKWTTGKNKLTASNDVVLAGKVRAAVDAFLNAQDFYIDDIDIDNIDVDELLR